MLERILLLFVFVLILPLLCFTALLSIIDETSDDSNKRDKKLYKKMRRLKKIYDKTSC